MPDIESRSEPDWHWYRSFLLVTETGSLSAAARELGLTQPTIGRHVESLENALGLKLFTRSPEGLSPTEAALELRPYAASIAATAAALRRAASSQQGSGAHGSVRGTVRITCSEIMGVEVLPPILVHLRADHPELVIELDLSNRAEDLLHRAADIAVRMFRPTQEALIATRVGQVDLGFFAHEKYLAQHGTPTSMNDLDRHTLIGFDRETAFIRQTIARVNAKNYLRAQLGFRADSDLAQVAMVRAGYGIGVCHSPLAAQDVRLVRVLKKQFALPLDTWVAMHEDLRESPRCSVTFAALTSGLSAYINGPQK